MKTIRELLMELPEDVRDAAINNCIALNPTGVINEISKRQDLYGAISCAFFWAESPEGHDFWENIQSKLKI